MFFFLLFEYVFLEFFNNNKLNLLDSEVVIVGGMVGLFVIVVIGVILVFLVIWYV